MGAARIELEIGPIGVGRIAVDGAPPEQSFAPRGRHRAHASGLRIVGIKRQKFLIPLDRVALENGAIGLIGRNVAQGLVQQRAARLHRRLGLRRGGLARLRGGGFGWLRRKQNLIRRQAAGAPRRLRAARFGRHAQARFGKGVGDGQARLPQHFDQRLGVNAIRPLPLGGHRAGRRVEGVERIVLRLDQRQTAGQRLALPGEGVGAREIERDHARARRQPGERAQEIRQAHGFDRRGDGVGERRLHRGEIVFTLILQAAAGEIDEDFRLRASRRRATEKFAKGGADLVLREIGGAGDVEPGLTQNVGDQTGVVGGGDQRVDILRIADDQRDARDGRVSGGRRA